MRYLLIFVIHVKEIECIQNILDGFYLYFLDLFPGKTSKALSFLVHYQEMPHCKMEKDKKK